MEASRKPAKVEGLSRFLVEHEACDGGFDINHPSGVGSGRVTVTCSGCGARFEYLRDGIAAGGEAGTQPPPAPPAEPRRRPPAPARPAPARRPGRPGSDRPARPRGEDRPRDAGPSRPLRWNDPRALALIVLAAAAVTFAVISIADGGDEGTPAPETGEAPASPGAGQGSPGSGETGPGEEGAAADFAGIRTATFAIGSPRSWSQGVSGRALLLRAPSGAAAVRVYSQRAPDLGLRSMAAGTAGLLRRRSGGGEVSALERTRYRGYRAFRMQARSKRLRLRATGILAGDRRYLILTSLRRGAPARARRDARRVEFSLKAR